MNVGLTPNPDELAGFLKLLKGADRYDLVAIEPDGKVVAKTFDVGREADLTEWVRRQNETHGIYFHPNTVRKDVRNRKARKEEIAEAIVLHADIDDPEALERIRAFNPKPSVIVFRAEAFSPTGSLASRRRISTASNGSMLKLRGNSAVIMRTTWIVSFVLPTR